MDGKIKEICENIQKYISLYILGELTFEEAFDKAYPHYEKLFTIRYKKIIDKFIDVKDIAKEDKNDN